MALRLCLFSIEKGNSTSSLFSRLPNTENKKSSQELASKGSAKHS